MFEGGAFAGAGTNADAFSPTAAGSGLLLLGAGPPLSEGAVLLILALLSGIGGIETGGGYSVNHLDIAPVLRVTFC